MSEPKTPSKNASSDVAPGSSSSAELDAFLNKVQSLQPAAAGTGRMIFAMDATMSRQPTWDLPHPDIVEQLGTVKEVGGLDVQLIYFRGFGECRSSSWVGDPDALARLMRQVHCEGGHTQIRKVLSHARRETERQTVNALVYVGDCMEESIDDLSQFAGELGLVGVPVFVFQEGHDVGAEKAFKEIARLSRGAYCRFDAGSAAQLRALLKAVAVYATGGRKAPQNGKSDAATLLLEQLR